MVKTSIAKVSVTEMFVIEASMAEVLGLALMGRGDRDQGIRLGAFGKGDYRCRLQEH